MRSGTAQATAYARSVQHDSSEAQEAQEAHRHMASNQSSVQLHCPIQCSSLHYLVQQAIIGVKMIKLIVSVKGSAKSGNRGHAGRKGKVGGSAPKSANAEPTERDIKLPPNKFTGTQGEVSARARERVKIMEEHFPGIRFSDFTPNQLGLQEAKKRGEPGVSLPQAMYDRTAQQLTSVSENDKVQAVVQEFKKWAVQPVPYVNTNALKFGTGLSYQEVFGVLNHLRSQDPHNISVSIDRLGNPTHVRINQ